MSVNDRSSSDRREYFRLEEQVNLRVRLVDAGIKTIDPYDPVFEIPPMLHLMSEFNRLDIEVQHGLKVGYDGRRGVPSALKAMNRKVDCLARMVLAGRDNISPDTLVSISEGGLSFHSDTPLPDNAVVHLLVVLFPEFVSIASLGRVTYCREHFKTDSTPDAGQPSSRESFVVGVEFFNLGETDRQHLSRHIFHEQSRAIRRRNDTTQ